MKTGYYKLIDREGYLNNNASNSLLLHTHLEDNCFYVTDVREAHSGFIGLSNSGSVLILHSELRYFEYIGKTMKYPFDLERALKGDKVVTRDNREVKGLEHNISELCGYIGKDFNIWELSGRFCRTNDISIKDLFMAHKEPEEITIPHPTVGLIDLIKYNYTRVLNESHNSIKVPKGTNDLIRVWKLKFSDYQSIYAKGTEQQVIKFIKDVKLKDIIEYDYKPKYNDYLNCAIDLTKHFKE